MEVLFMTFWDRIQILCKEKQTTPTALCKSLGLSTSMVTRWKNGTIPTNSTLLLIAEHLGVDSNYLMWGSSAKEKSPDESELDEVEAYLAEIGIEIRSMDDSDRRELKNYVEYLVSRRKKG